MTETQQKAARRVLLLGRYFGRAVTGYGADDLKRGWIEAQRRVESGFYCNDSSGKSVTCEEHVSQPWGNNQAAVAYWWAYNLLTELAGDVPTTELQAMCLNIVKTDSDIQAGNEASKQAARSQLAEAVHQHIQSLRDRINPVMPWTMTDKVPLRLGNDSFIEDWERRESAIAEEDDREVEWLTADVQNGMWRWDALLIDYLKQEFQTFKPDTPSAKAQSGYENFRQTRDPYALLGLWLDPGVNPTHMTVTNLLATMLWNELVKEKWEREQQADNAPSHRILAVQDESGDQYVKVPKVASAIGWSFGGKGVAVEIDGDKYPKAPAITRYVSRSNALLPKTKRPAQLQLPVGFDEQEDIPFALGVTQDSQFVFNPMVAKVALYMLATTGSGFNRSTVGDVTRDINPSKKRIRRRDHETTVQAFRDLRTAVIVLLDNTDVTLFDIRAPADPNKALHDQPLVWAFGRNLMDVGGAGLLKALRGEFVLNLTGAMRLSAKEAALLRQYIAACSLWNDAKNPSSKRFDPQFLEQFTIEDWAQRTNTLSTEAAQYLSENNPGKRHKLSRDRKRTKKGLEALKEEHELIELEVKGVGLKQRYKILPPRQILDAYEKHRKGHQRPQE